MPDQFGGTVWGTGVYTTDSALCQAALHAGAVSARGGRVRVTRRPGAKSYQGSRRNGVTTHDWGSYPHSFRFVAADTEATGPAREPGASPSEPSVHFGL